jgi:hypothetical protein
LSQWVIASRNCHLLSWQPENMSSQIELQSKNLKINTSWFKFYRSHKTEQKTPTQGIKTDHENTIKGQYRPFMLCMGQY